MLKINKGHYIEYRVINHDLLTVTHYKYITNKINF